MLKFVKHHMETISGIEIYPLISFVIFFTFFLVVLGYIYMQRSEYFDKISQLPLDDSNTSTTRPEL